MALNSVRASKLRSFLTILGVMIGVSSVIGLASIINGLDAAFNQEIDSMGSNTIMITKIGNDEFASIALNSFKGEGMTTDYIFKDETASTGAALIMVDENTGQNKIIVTLGASDNITHDEIKLAKKQIIASDVLLMQLETNFDAIEHAVSIAHATSQMS